MKKYAAWLSAAAIVILLVLLNWLVFSQISLEGLRSFLAGFGMLAPVAYMLCFAILPVFFFPVAVLALAGGLMFGLVWGSIYTFIGAVVNCALMFLLSRKLARNKARAAVEARLPEKWKAVLFDPAGKRSFLLLVVLRLIPAVPYNLINYSMGLTQMNFTTYMLGSIIGIIPGLFVFINISDKALDVTSPAFWNAVGLLAALLLITALLGKKLFPDTNNTEEKSEHEQI
ncbi:MAG: TVP38/TMEM64 family protein [Candidatus Pelethousia sp.]|nr:TVP38/TMEM64 family protein [Candidatus Pelethousia sp.]